MEFKTGQSMERLHDDPKSSSSNNPGISLVLSVVALILALVAIVIGSVSLGQKGISNNNYINGADSSVSSDSSGALPQLDWVNNPNDDKIWTLQVGHDASSWEYLDEVSGTIKGFHVDIADAVCKRAGKNCRMVFDLYQRCWDAKAGETQRGGDGLFGGYYDACTGWQHSYARARAFHFSNAYSKKFMGVFVTKVGNPNNFNWRNITGKKIGFIDGFVFDEFCVAREEDRITGASLPSNMIIHYPNRDALVDAVTKGEVDAAFDGRETYYNANPQILEIVSDNIESCNLDGFSMMMRKDGTLWQWFNPALEKLIGSSEYGTICNDLLDAHGHVPGAKPEDVCIGM